MVFICFPTSPDRLTKSHDRLPKLAVKPWVRPSPPQLILRNAQVIDPASESVLKGFQDVTIDDGLISSVSPVGTSPQSEYKPDEPQPVIYDLAGKFLCPYAWCRHVRPFFGPITSAIIVVGALSIAMSMSLLFQGRRLWANSSRPPQS